MLSADDISTYVGLEGKRQSDSNPFFSIGDYAVSTVVDLATSVADSLTLGYCDNALCETDKALSAIDETFETNFSNFYEDNQALVNVTSLIGGTFLPFGAAKLASGVMKSGQASGSLVPKFYQNMERGAKVNKLRAQRALRDYGEESLRYKTAMRQFGLNTTGAGIAQGVAWEAGFFATMNGHAFIEDNYDVVDFVVGAGLGAMAGPIKYLMANHELKTGLLKTQEEQVGAIKDIIGYQAAGHTKGDSLANISFIYREAQQFDTTTLNQWQQGNLRGYAEQTLVNVRRTVDRMSDNTFTVPKAERTEDYQKILNGLQYSNPYDVSDSMMLSRMSVENPNTFVGVEAFSHYDEAEDTIQKLVDHTLVQRPQGEMLAIDGLVASRVIAPEWGDGTLETARHIAGGFDDSVVPAGVEVATRTRDGRMVTEITIPNSKYHKGRGNEAKQFREWAFKFLNSGERQGTPVVLRSADGHLVGLKTEKLAGDLRAEKGKVDLLLGSNDLTSTRGKFVTPAQVDEVVGTYNTDFGVINKFFGHNITPSTLSRITMTAAGDSRVVVNPKANSFTKWDYKPFEMNTQTADGMFLEAGYALKNDKVAVITQQTIDSANIPQLQLGLGSLLKNLDKEGLIYKVKVGKEVREFTANNVDEMQELLIAEKAKVAQEVVKRGGTYEQAAIYTNMKVEDIEKLHQASWDAATASPHLSGYAVYTGDDIDKFAKAKPMAVYGKHRRFAELEELKAHTALDMNTIRDAHGAIIRENVAISGLQEAQEILDATVFDDSFKVIRDNLERLLTTLDRPSRILSSADQALRKQGQIGELIVTLGQNMVHTTNAQWTKIQDNIGMAFRGVAQSQVDIVQFEQIKRAIQADTKHVIKFDPATGKFALQGEIVNGEQQYLKYLGTENEITATRPMQTFMQAYLPEAERMYKTINLLRRNNNMPPLPDRGVWFPYEAVEDRFIAFQINKKNPHDLQIITANTAGDLKDKIAAMTSDPSITQKFDVVTREQVGRWNEILDYATLNPLKQADSSFKKSGIALHEPTGDPRVLDDLLGAMQSSLWRHNRMLMKQAGAEVFQKLENASALANQAEKSSVRSLAQKLKEKHTVADVAYSTLLNTSLMSKYPRLLAFNDMTAVSINQALNTSSDILKTALNRNDNTVEAFAELGRRAQAEGIPLPWQNVEEYLRAKNKSAIADMAQHRVAQVNGISATLNLRLFEISHSILTVLSTPVILSGQLANMKYPMKTFMDVAAEMGKYGPETKAILKEARDRGYITNAVAEATDLMANLHTARNLNDSRFSKAIKLLSKPSDMSEEWTRAYSYLMGYRLAQQRGITDPSLLRSAAHNFTIRGMGNYTSRQRPVLFQGTFGSIIGLYQTFMVTMGQNMYRYIEGADRKAIMALMGAQAGMFGLESLPFYQPFNRMIGAHYGEGDGDIRSTMYEAFGGEDDNKRSAAEFMLYGVPSALFQSAFYTRGELEPRAPFKFDPEAGLLGLQPAAINNMAQLFTAGFDTVSNVSRSIANKGDAGDWLHAGLQSFAAQSVWRPGARLSEVFMGRSYDRKGELISGPEDVIGDGWPMLTRVLASRPLKEQALRNNKFNAGYYNTVDRAEKQKISRQVRRMIARGEDRNLEAFQELQGEYLEKGGSPVGWKRMMKNAYTEASSSYAERMAKFFKDNEAYSEIFNDYE